MESRAVTELTGDAEPPIGNALEVWQSPPPHWKGPDRYHHPQTLEAWNPHNDEVGAALDASVRRINFARDLADPRAPDQMTLVLRLDLIRLMGDWQHKCAYFQHHTAKAEGR